MPTARCLASTAGPRLASSVPGNRDGLVQQRPPRVRDPQHRPGRAARLTVPPEQHLVAQQSVASAARSTDTTVACRALALTTTGSGRYSSRPPAATCALTRSSDSSPSSPGSAIAAAAVRSRRRAPALNGDPQGELVPAERPGRPAHQVHRRRRAPQHQRRLRRQHRQPGDPARAGLRHDLRDRHHPVPPASASRATARRKPADRAPARRSGRPPGGHPPGGHRPGGRHSPARRGGGGGAGVSPGSRSVRCGWGCRRRPAPRR